MTALDHATQTMHAATRPAAVTRVINAVSAFFRAWGEPAANSTDSAICRTPNSPISA